jgi:hypothetical protein
MQLNGAKMSTDKLRKELGIKKERVEIKGWKLPYEVLSGRTKVKTIQQPTPKRPQPQQNFKPKPKPKNKGIQFKKAF